MIQYVEPEQALAAADSLGFHVRDDGLLFSALARPSASAFGKDAYECLELKAAALMTSIARNHALVDGNKRFALYLTFAFFKLNGYRIVMSNDVAFDLVLAVATGSMELGEIALVFSRHLVDDV